jgi:hypothetical protein
MAFLPKLLTGDSVEREMLEVQRGILDATQASAKAAAYQSEQMGYQSELLDTMVSAIRSLQRAIVNGMKVGNALGAAPKAVQQRSRTTDEPEQLTRVKTSDGKVVYRNSQGQFASKSAAEQKERDAKIIDIFSGVELAVSYMNELISEQTAMLDTLVRSNRSVSGFLKSFVRRVTEDKKSADAAKQHDDLEQENEKANERNKKPRENLTDRRSKKFSSWEAILDGFATILKGLLIPLLIGFGDGLDKSLGWIGKVTDGFKTLCGWVGDAVTGLNKWFNGDEHNPGIFNKWLDHVHDVFGALADFDPRDVIKKILTALPESVKDVIPDSLLEYARMGKYALKPETQQETISRKNRENVVGVAYEQKFDVDQQKKWNEIGEKIKKQGYASAEDREALSKIIGDSRGFLGRTFGSDEDQDRYINSYTQQMSMRGKIQQQRDTQAANATLASGGPTGNIDTDALWSKLAPVIAKGESGAGGYEAHNGPPIPGLTEMTLDAVSKLKGAVGKYQFLPQTTLIDAARWAGLKMSDKFSPENQEKMGRALFDRRVRIGMKDGTSGIQKQLALEWASLPKDTTGMGAWDGYAGNKAAGGAERGSFIASAINSSQNVPAPSMAPAKQNDAGAKLSEMAVAQKQPPVVAPAQVVAPTVNNIKNSQTINQAPLSATTPAEFSPHV